MAKIKDKLKKLLNKEEDYTPDFKGIERIKEKLKQAKEEGKEKKVERLTKRAKRKGADWLEDEETVGSLVAEGGKKAIEEKIQNQPSTPAAAPKKPKIVKIKRNLEGERKEIESPTPPHPIEKKPMESTPMEDPEVLLSNLNKAMQEDFQQTKRVQQAKAAMQEEKKIKQPMIIERFKKLKKEEEKK